MFCHVELTNRCYRDLAMPLFSLNLTGHLSCALQAILQALITNLMETVQDNFIKPCCCSCVGIPTRTNADFK